jgi:hypothetical protein
MVVMLVKRIVFRREIFNLTNTRLYTDVLSLGVGIDFAA